MVGRHLMAQAVDAVIIVLAATLLLIAAVGGVEFDIGGLALRARNWTRPAVALAFVLAARAIVAAAGAKPKHTLPPVAGYVARCGLTALIIATAAAYLHYHVRVAGGLDSYGYVSAAGLIASGRLSEPQPLAATLPFENPIAAATPLGHVAGTDGRSSVPRFPLGMPVVMALFTTFGPTGPFFVPLLMAYAVLVVAYLIGRAMSDRLAGLFAAALVAVNPVFVVYAIHPMSDVPAIAWLLLAVAMTLKKNGSPTSVFWSVVAGICAGMAALTRPALFPAVLVLTVVSIYRDRSRWRLAMPATVLVFAILQVVLNVRLYGAATMSGYGTPSHMFELSFARFAANAANFANWLTYSHSPVIWIMWPISLVVLRRHRWTWVLSAVAAAAAVPYLFYIVFNNWDSTRFLLPSIVLVVILFACAVAELWGLPPSSPAPRALLLIAIAFGFAFTSHRILHREGIAMSATLEAKYALVGDWFKTNTSDRAVVFSSLHSGTIRLYGDRQTIRWDQIPPDALDATITRLTTAGYEPYLALDLPSEPPEFEERFKSQSVQIEPVARVRVVNISKLVSAR